MTRVKICGLTRDEDARAVAAAGASALGFVFWPDSPRVVTPATARRLAEDVATMTRVGVFVNASPDEVARAVRLAKLQAVQLHGDESVDDYRHCGATLIRAVALTDDASVERALALPDDVTLLVDAHAPERRGGTGQLANWARAARVAAARPVLLAGGLHPGNVADAIHAVRPWAVDVSSGVESAPGVKDSAKVAALMRAVSLADGKAL